MSETALAFAREEQLWAGAAGNAYVERTRGYGAQRGEFWTHILSLVKPRSVLEVGCGTGLNLRHLRSVPELAGVDINAASLDELWRDQQVRGVLGSLAHLPFADQQFDLVFTAGVLIHVPALALPQAFDELARVSRRWVLTVEYEDSHEREIPWRGHRDVLWARPHALSFWRQCPEFVPIARGEAAAGFDRQGWALFSRYYDDLLAALPVDPGEAGD